MNALQKMVVSLVLTLCCTFGLLLAWQQEWFGFFGPTAVQADTVATPAPPVPKVIIPAHLAGNVQPLPEKASETDSFLQKDPGHAKLIRKQTERYLESLKTVEGRVIGSFQTSLGGRNASGRVKNIELASQKLNGTVLLPGEVLSFNTILGDSNDPRSGWQLATVIVGKKFVDGYGGGICQVSSTLYNSVLNAGLQVKERYTHSLPVGYVRPGQDATVSYPELDFRFVNSGNAPIRVETYVQNGNVIARILVLPTE